MTRTTRTTVSSSVNLTSWTESRIGDASGRSGCRACTRRRQLRLELRQQRLDRVDDLRRCSCPAGAGSPGRSHGSPLYQLAVPLFSTPSYTCATSLEPDGTAVAVRDDHRPVRRRRPSTGRSPARRSCGWGRRASRSAGSRWRRAIADATSSMPICRAASCVGSTSMRTAYFCAPKTLTCATPLTIDRRCARTVSAYWSTCESGSVSRAERQEQDRRVGRVDLLVRRRRRHLRRQLSAGVRAIIDCTSCAAASMLRLRSNCSVMLVLPWRVARADRGHARDRRELLFERRGDRRGHRLRACAGQVRVDLNGRDSRGRQVADRQQTVAHDAEDAGCRARAASS